MQYDINRPWLSLDDWQKAYIDSEGNNFLLTGRQVGKSTAMSIKAVETALKSPKGYDVLIIALTERQAYNLFSKALSYAMAKYPGRILSGKDKPTKHEIKFDNGVKIMCHPTGLMGEGLRGFTLGKLFVDEAARMSDEVFVSVMPMLSVTGGTVDMASTPVGKQGYFYECSKRKDFNKFYVSAEDCPRHDKEFLESEKRRMSKLQYAQEYLAVFLDELKRYFSDELIVRCCKLKRKDGFDNRKKYYLGVDIARMGEDDSTFEILMKEGKYKMIQIDSIVTSKTYTTETEKKIIDLHKIYNFRQIYIDAGSGSLGVGILDHLLDIPAIKNKVVAINNRERLLDSEGNQKKKIMKEDLYDNLRALMERGEIELLDDDELKASLASVQYEYVIKPNKMSQMHIFGSYTHIAEGLIRATWGMWDNSLELWCR